jgi:hypothetical protein
MRNLLSDPDHHHCPCGALREKTSTRCRKCRARLGWYRRKAWRVNPARLQPDPAATFPEEVITR